MPTTGALQLAGPPTKPHTHTHTRHTHIYICRVSCACVQEIGARVHDDCMLTTVCVALVYAYIYIYTHTHANALYLSTGGSSVCGVVCVCSFRTKRASTHTPHHTTNRRSPPHYAPTEPVPLPPPPPPPPHTHTLCVCVCGLVAEQQASKQERAQTRSFGVCTANQTHTDDETRRRDWIITRPHCPLLLTPVSGPHLLEITLE